MSHTECPFGIHKGSKRCTCNMRHGGTVNGHTRNIGKSKDVEGGTFGGRKPKPRRRGRSPKGFWGN